MLLRPLSLLAALCLTALPAEGAGPYGQAQKPPMGWRSWNAFHGSITQDIMQTVMHKMAEKRNGTKSLLDLGYSVVGLDDNWQKCGAGYNGSFHDDSGRPIVRTDTFPDMKGMVASAHELGLLAGFYLNNCICRESGITNESWVAAVYAESVNVFVNEWKFDGVKLDGCSQFHNTTLWSSLMAATGKPVLVENCHNTHQPTAVPDPAWPNGECPYNWFRTSSDINAHWDSIMNNIATVPAFQDRDTPISGRGCWSYPDMLEVGQLASFEENRAHFGAWAIVSSPLILGYDLTKDDITNAVWPIISNEEAIAVNQNWAGHPGFLVRAWTPPGHPSTGHVWLEATTCDPTDAAQEGFTFDGQTLSKAGRCADYGVNSKTDLVMTPCDSKSKTQAFSHGSDGELKAGDKCMDVWCGHGRPCGPKVQIATCHEGANQKFNISGGRVRTANGQCFSATTTDPAGNSGVKDAAFSLWAKPQPGGAVAAFVLSNQQESDGENGTVTIDIHADLGMPADVAEAEIRCVWMHKDMGSTTGGKFTTMPLRGHDSMFFIFTKKTTKKK